MMAADDPDVTYHDTWSGYGHRIMTRGFELGHDGRGNVLGRAFWGRGIATRALATFLAEVNRTRPIYARVAKDKIASRRVLDRCGFNVIGEDVGFAHARGEEIEELLLERGVRSDRCYPGMN